MLFKSLGIPEQDEMFISHTFWWRGSKRSCDVLFTNVRTLPDESLRSTDDWKLIIDFPFDTEGHSPIEDLDRLNKFREKNERQRTLVWLPSFFSTRTQAELGKLVIIDRLLLGNNLDQHAKHLSLQDRQTARLLLQNQQSALSQRLLQAVEAAYAIRSEPTPGTLDAAYDMSESHFQSLFPTLVLQRPVGANLGEALEHLLDQALSHQFPKHPKFGQEIKLGKDLRQVLEVCQEAARTPDGRVFVEDKAVRQKLINICNPLELGQMSGDALRPGQLLEEPLQPPAGGVRAAASHGGGLAAVDEPARGARAAPGDPEPADSGLRRSDESLVRAATAATTRRPSTTCRTNWSFRSRRCPT